MFGVAEFRVDAGAQFEQATEEPQKVGETVKVCDDIRPGIFARLRSFALNILRANGVGNVSEAIYTNALSLDRLLAHGLPKSQN